MDAAGFKEAFPEFSGADDNRIQYWLAQYASRFRSGAFGDETERATACWIAWRLNAELRRTVSGGAGSASSAAIVEQQVGQIRVKYSEETAKAAIENPYLSDDYGREFDELTAPYRMGAVAV